MLLFNKLKKREIKKSSVPGYVKICPHCNRRVRVKKGDKNAFCLWCGEKIKN